jgi:[acyl-carrier-protein] S-malonyltransferase
MDAFLADVALAEPGIPVFSNVTADVHDGAAIRSNMVKQITSSVQWVASIQKLVADGVEEIVEVGPGKVLAGLIKRIDNTVSVRNIGQLTDIENQ